MNNLCAVDGFWFGVGRILGEALVISGVCVLVLIVIAIGAYRDYLYYKSKEK